ncbi:hypothetical protein EVAR_36864_1 [Eumeta japonica]|uniref:Uncharacterized protein n=1 Tax=Eumeta variegata TaxID=151549 RepID=A0A4C1WRU7_EUMVA|nr:hypothetical protein EVAR_36864_1 [Eumeta japonica]
MMPTECPRKPENRRVLVPTTTSDASISHAVLNGTPRSRLLCMSGAQNVHCTPHIALIELWVPPQKQIDTAPDRAKAWYAAIALSASRHHARRSVKSKRAIALNDGTECQGPWPAPAGVNVASSQFRHIVRRTRPRVRPGEMPSISNRAYPPRRRYSLIA